MLLPRPPPLSLALILCSGPLLVQAARLASRVSDDTELWTSGGPDYDDVIQVVDYDCWFAAASIAVTHASVNWVENLYYYPTIPPTSMAGADSPSTSTALVTIFDPTTLAPINYTVSVSNESTTEDTPGGVWWHSALIQAVFLLAENTAVDGVFDNATFIPYYGDAYVGMTMLTGLAATQDLQSDMSGMDELYGLLTRAISTPVTFSTLSTVAATTPPIEPDHAYGVLYTTESDQGNRTVTVRNPWGATDTFQLQDVWNNIYAVERLTNNDTLVWTGQPSVPGP